MCLLDCRMGDIDRCAERRLPFSTATPRQFPGAPGKIWGSGAQLHFASTLRRCSGSARRHRRAWRGRVTLTHTLAAESRQAGFFAARGHRFLPIALYAIGVYHVEHGIH